jgi:hypothetical protein
MSGAARSADVCGIQLIMSADFATGAPKSSERVFVKCLKSALML